MPLEDGILNLWCDAVPIETGCLAGNVTPLMISLSCKASIGYREQGCLIWWDWFFGFTFWSLIGGESYAPSQVNTGTAMTWNCFKTSIFHFSQPSLPHTIFTTAGKSLPFFSQAHFTAFQRPNGWVWAACGRKTPGETPSPRGATKNHITWDVI